MRRLLILTMVLGFVLLNVAPCFAENFLNKLGRGLVNGATGFGEYPKQIVETSKEHNIAVGLTWGQLKGVGMGVARTGLGVYDVLTCYVPPYDEPVLEPEYVFQ